MRRPFCTTDMRALAATTRSERQPSSCFSMLAMALRAFLLVVYLFTPAEGLDELLGRDLVTTAPSAPDAIPTDFAFARPENLKVFRLYRLVGSELNFSLFLFFLLLWRNALFPFTHAQMTSSA